MRLALLSPLPPEQTGIADHAAHCRWALHHAGVEVLTPLQGQRPLTSLAAAKAWVAERDWRRVDVVHAELGAGRLSEFYALAALAALPSRPALSATVHAPDRLVWRPVQGLALWAQKQAWVPRPVAEALVSLASPLTLRAERRLARQLDGIAVHTQLGAQRLTRRLRLRPERLSVIPHGVIGLPTKPLPPLEPLRLMYFGFIHKGKGIEDLIDAVGRLRAKHPDLAGRVRLCIAGGSAPDVPQASGRAYLQALRARVERRGITTQVDWELDVDERDLPDLIQRHHLVVLPHREPRRFWGRACGSSGALAWALACGRGVITSNARAFPEEMAQGIGATYPQGDVGALTQQLVQAASEPDVMRRWAEQAAALALTRAWPTTGQRFAGHFQRTLERTPRQHSV
jgi:glycosyltransferase involved in cell wall biosynthesis